MPSENSVKCSYFNEEQGSLKDLISCFRNKVSIIVGPTNTGKTRLATYILSKIGGCFFRAYCFAPSDSTQDSPYNLLFGNNYCFSKFATFSEWHRSVEKDQKKYRDLQSKILENEKFLRELLYCLPTCTRNEVLEYCKTFTETIEDEKKRRAGFLEALKYKITNMSRQVYKGHLAQTPNCGGIERCTLCMAICPRSVLIVLDDFYAFQKEVFTNHFVQSFSGCRHLNISIMILCQMPTQVPRTARTNTSTRVFTTVEALTNFYNLENISPTTCRDLISNLAHSKKLNEYYSLVIDNNSMYSKGVIAILASENIRRINQTYHPFL